MEFEASGENRMNRVNIMRYKRTTFLLIFLLSLSSLFSARNIKETDLPEKYRGWLKQTSYIILPQEKDVAPAYATHFFNYKGVVSTDSLTNYIESIAEIALIIDPVLNISFLHFSISPVSFSIDYLEPNEQYYCNFKLSVCLRKNTEIIFQYSKDFPFYFHPDEAD